jgi:hypothetical protein
LAQVALVKEYLVHPAGIFIPSCTNHYIAQMWIIPDLSNDFAHDPGMPNFSQISCCYSQSDSETFIVPAYTDGIDRIIIICI